MKGRLDTRDNVYILQSSNYESLHLLLKQLYVLKVLSSYINHIGEKI